MSRIVIIIACFMLFICCSQDEYEDVLVRFSGSIPEGEYWWSTFSTFPYSQTSVEFDLISGDAVDIIVLDHEGFLEFENRIGLDSLMVTTWGLQLEEYVSYSFYADSGQHLHFNIWWAIDTLCINPVEIFLMDSLNFSLYSQGAYLHGTYACFYCLGTVFDYNVVRSESLYFVMDNTSYGYPPIGVVCYRFELGEYIARAFSYYEGGSIFNTGTIACTFDAPEHDTVYIVINNAGFVDGGAIPAGPVEFSINVTEE